MFCGFARECKLISLCICFARFLNIIFTFLWSFAVVTFSLPLSLSLSVPLSPSVCFVFRGFCCVFISHFFFALTLYSVLAGLLACFFFFTMYAHSFTHSLRSFRTFVRSFVRSLFITNRARVREVFAISPLLLYSLAWYKCYSSLNVVVAADFFCFKELHNITTQLLVFTVLLCALDERYAICGMVAYVWFSTCFAVSLSLFHSHSHLLPPSLSISTYTFVCVYLCIILNAKQKKKIWNGISVFQSIAVAIAKVFK